MTTETFVATADMKLHAVLDTNFFQQCVVHLALT